MPQVSVYIASHNYGRFLEASIESVLRQSLKDWELLVINDGSTDDTKNVMSLYKSDSRIRLFDTPGIGLPKVCNLALREAKGEYIIRLDGDDLFDDQILLVLTTYLNQNPDTGLVFPDYYLVDEAGNIVDHTRRENVRNRNQVVDIPPNGACTMIRTQTLRDIGGYREDLGVQDGFDMWSKVRGQCKCDNINLPLFYYRRHNQNITNNQMRILSARRQIKRDAVTAALESCKPFIAVIPCRSRYDFQPDVWNLKLNSQTLLERDVQSCLSSDLFDHVVVACDNPEAENVIRAFKKDERLKFMLRSPDETIRSKSLVPTLEKIAKAYDPSHQGVMVISYVQAPFVRTGTLEEAAYTLLLNQTDSAVGVEEVKSPLYRRSSFGMGLINPPGPLSSDFDTIYRETYTAFAMKSANLKRGSLTGLSLVNFIVTPEESLFISSEQNLKIAKAIAGEP